MNHNKTWLTSMAIGAFALSAFAQEKPNIMTISPLYGGALKNMSANGEWAVGDAVNPDNSSYSAFPRMVNTSTGETIELFTEKEGQQSAPIAATCVSNDGKRAAGSFYGYPAVWKEGKGWSSLTMPKGKYNGGLVSDMTPDGKYAVGRVSIDGFKEYPCMWDLETSALIELPGMIDSNPRNQDMIEAGGDPSDWTDDELNVRLTGISADGNTLLGMVDFVFPATAWEFVYHRDSSTWTPLGMKYEGGRLVALDPDIYNVDECVFSADGAYIGGTYYSVSDTSVPFSCKTGSESEYSLHKEGEGYGIWAIGSDGTLYGSAPLGTPVRNWSAKVGNYWYDWKMVYKQIYGVDWMTDVTKDDLGLSGSVVAVSADNKKILAADYAQNISYIITLPKPMTEICGDVDLLAEYSAFPPEGAEFSMLQTIVLDMGREVEVCAEKTAVSLLDSEGNRIRTSINFSTQADSKKKLEIIFRNFNLEPGADYTVEIPAGAISIAGDAERTNKEIRIYYRGREAGPVKPIAFSPADGASVARINLTTNPVTVTFNATLNVGESPSISLYQSKDGVEEYLYPLSAVVSGRQVMIYPVSEQRLAEGCDYRIEFGAGSVTDLSGDGPNEAFSILYHGSYVPDIDPSSNTIFFDDFSQGVGRMMLYDGDGNNPSEEMTQWGFDNVNTPWLPLKDDNDTAGDYAAASHSNYDPAGKSDDWMVTPQLFIPDDKVSLSFKSQSHKLDKKDMLKVFVWESDEVVTIITPNIADKIRYNGDMVYNELQSPGEQEETLSGEWLENYVELSKYAGKNVYIAFVNDNQNQSAVFVDDVLVSREMPAIISVDTEKTVVDLDEIKIKGRFVAMKETGLKGYTLTLRDNEGNELSSITSDEELEKGETCAFNFPDAVALHKGATDVFDIVFTSGPESISLKHEIRNLLFRTTKRLVLEEMTGSTCQFCPQGIIATEYLQEVFGDVFIPVAIHSYTGDSFGGAEQSAYSGFLGLNAAPTGVVCRGASASPMYFDGSDYVFTSPDGKTWLQKAEESLAELPVADITVTNAEIDENANKVTVNMSVNFAIALNAANINIFGVVMEDALFGIQSNGLSNVDAPGLQEWGKDGAYGKSRVMWDYDDVVRGTSAIETGGIYTGFNGKGGYIPSNINTDKPYDVTFDFAYPSSVSDINNVKVCVMLIDANTGEYINAAVSPCSGAGVGTIASDGDKPGVVFDLAGRIVMRDATPADLHSLEKGIYILGGKKYIIQ